VTVASLVSKREEFSSVNHFALGKDVCHGCEVRDAKCARGVFDTWDMFMRGCLQMGAVWLQADADESGGRRWLSRRAGRPIAMRGRRLGIWG
jgi:hypothetical protein